MDLADILRQHTSLNLTGDKDRPHRVTVRRGHILEDAVASLRCYDETKHLRVTFLGEPAVDEGGPRREFFMLLLGDVANNGSLLDGSPERRVLRHNASAFQVSCTVYS